MRNFIFLLILISNLFAVEKTEVFKLYKEHKYLETCNKGMWIFNENKNDPVFKSIIAISCVNAGMINTAIRVAKFMNDTPLDRHNASYVASLFLAKKLLLQFLYDKINLSNISLPKSSHPLSIILEHIASNNYTLKNDKYIINYNDKEYILSKTTPHRFIIKIYNKNHILLSKRLYW